MADRALDLDALKALEVKATPGPWAIGDHDETLFPITAGSERGWRHEHWVIGACRCDACRKEPVEKFRCGVPTDEDAALIVAARNALPTLIAAAEERDWLRTRLAAARQYCEEIAPRNNILTEIEKMRDTPDDEIKHVDHELLRDMAGDVLAEARRRLAALEAKEDDDAR